MVVHLSSSGHGDTGAADRRVHLTEEGAALLALNGALRKARQGTLAPDWRANLRAKDIVPGLLDVSQAAVDALRAAPVAPWEPWAAGGDWRRALESWYAASIALSDRLGNGAARWRATEPDQAWGAPTIEAVAAEAQRETARREQVRRDRDALTASYLAGLAAGGDPLDWRGWFRARTGATEDQPLGYPDIATELPTHWTELPR